MSQFIYLLNAFEAASQHDTPAEVGYGAKRKALLEYVEKLESARPEALRSGETPRTNALTGTFYLRCDDCPQPEKCERMKSVHPDDARELERELVQAKADLAEVDEANTRLARDRQTAHSPQLRSQEKP